MVCIDSYDGHSFATAPLHIDRDVIEYIHEKKDHPYYNRQYAKVAIGEGQKVIALHHSGLLEVFSPVLVQVYAIHLEGLGDY
jgi:hypothetical protein